MTEHMTEKEKNDKIIRLTHKRRLCEQNRYIAIAVMVLLIADVWRHSKSSDTQPLFYLIMAALFVVLGIIIVRDHFLIKKINAAIAEASAADTAVTEPPSDK